MKIVQKYIAKQFAQPSGPGGYISAKVMNILNQSQYRAIQFLLSAEQEDTILDIGYGNGNLIKKLAKMYPATFYGIDLSYSMEKRASSKNRNFIEEGRVNLKVANINNIPFDDDFFTQIYTVNTLYFWPNIDESLAEIKRVLSPDGVFINTFYTNEYLDKLKYTSYSFSKYSLSEIQKKMYLNGFYSKVLPLKKGVSNCIYAKKIT